MKVFHAFACALALALLAAAPARADDDPMAFARAGMAVGRDHAASATHVAARGGNASVGEPMQLPGALLSMAARYVGLRHSPTGFRGSWCGDFLGFVAARVGVSRPRDYRLARAWARAGVASAPRVGAIAVLPHHVGIVAAVHAGSVTLLSGNHSHRVAYGEYSTRRVIAFRAV